MEFLLFILFAFWRAMKIVLKQTNPREAINDQGHKNSTSPTTKDSSKQRNYDKKKITVRFIIQ